MSKNFRLGNTPLDALAIQQISGLKILGARLEGNILLAATPDRLCDNSLIFFDDFGLETETEKLDKFKNILILISDKENVQLSCAHLRCKYPRQIWGNLVKKLYDYENLFVFHESKQYQNCEIGRDVKIAKSAIICHGCRIGDGTTIQDNVFVGPYTDIGEGCTIMTGSIIGGQGFGPCRYGKISESMPHIGGVLIKSGCEIGCGSIVDAGTIFPTVLETDVKTGSLVHVAHNASIGMGCFLAARSGVSGGASLGANCFLGAGAMVRDGVCVGKRVTMGLLSAVVYDIPDDSVVAGNPATLLKPLKK